MGVNNQGTVVGQVGVTWPDRAVIWDRAGGVTDLGTLPGGTSSTPNAINAQGVVVGYASTGGLVQPVRWDAPGRITALSLLPGGTGGSALRISDDGSRVIGNAFLPGNEVRPVFWDAEGKVAELERLPGGTTHQMIGLTDSGYVAGYVLTSGQPNRAVRWDVAGKITMLPSLGVDGFTVVVGITADGTAVGSSAPGRDAQSHVVRWSLDGALVDLGFGHRGQGGQDRCHCWLPVRRTRSAAASGPLGDRRHGGRPREPEWSREFDDRDQQRG
jgi:uncharacterized membrane protein